MDRLPFTDENLEIEAYKDKCDELSELEIASDASIGYKVWGRWFISEGMLKTWIILPKRENLPVYKSYTFDFSLETCRTKEQQDFIIEHLMTEDWIGESGLKSLKRAFKYLTKHSKNAKIVLDKNEDLQ
jgi:hypothetical protein